MKINRVLIVMIFLFLIIIVSMYILNNNYKKEALKLKADNYEYEAYLNQEINGVELATLINKVVNENEEHKVKKDKNNHYIDNGENSIKIDVKIMLTDKTYPMEEFYNNDTAEFVKYFQDERFICKSVEYHEKTGKISKLNFDQV